MSEKIRLGLPSKGRLQQDCLEFLLACDMRVAKKNPRQYTAVIASKPNLEVWFQRPADIVRQVRNGTMQLGIAGLDTVTEYSGNSDRIIMVHDALRFGACSLEVVIPEDWTDVNSMADLVSLARTRATQSDGEDKMRVVSQFPQITSRFFTQNGLTAYRMLHADGALEAAPHMGTADFITDLVETGTTLRENHLKTIEGGCILRSQACLFANKTALKENPETLTLARQLLEIFDAHLRAKQHYMLTANMRGQSAEEVACKLHAQTELGGLRGPTISPVYPKNPDGNGWFAINLVVKKDHLQTAIQQIRTIGGSGVIVSPATFIFEETPERWQRLAQALELE